MNELKYQGLALEMVSQVLLACWQKASNNGVNADPKKRRSFVALLFGSGYAKRSAKRQRPSMRGGICTPEATRFRGRATTLLIVKSVFPTVTLFPYWGIPSPHGFSKLQPFSVGAGPFRQTPEHPAPKRKGQSSRSSA